YMKFKNRGTGQYIDGLGLTANPSNLGQYKKSNSSNQEWTITNLPSARMASVALTNESKFQVQLNPNPFTSSLNLKVSRPEEVTSITIFDVSGRRVQTIEHSAVSNTMSVGASLKPGLYLVQVNGVNWPQSFKVVKK
ncbi:MAG: T9SS type A sorting domain-containing protein, partial [Ferruginibacter sp.]